MDAIPQVGAISEWLTDPQWLQDVKEQLEKDFETSGAEFPKAIMEAADFPAFYSLLKPTVEFLFLNRNEKFRSLLYRVDLPEHLIKKAGQQFPKKKNTEILTELLILRELQKVWIRKNYEG